MAEWGVETRFGIFFKDEADIDSKQMFWWDALTYNSWLVLGVAFLEGDQKPRTLNIMGILEGSVNPRKGFLLFEF